MNAIQHGNLDTSGISSFPSCTCTGGYLACGADLIILKVMLGEGKSFRLYISELAP